MEINDISVTISERLMGGNSFRRGKTHFFCWKKYLFHRYQTDRDSPGLLISPAALMIFRMFGRLNLRQIEFLGCEGKKNLTPKVRKWEEKVEKTNGDS